MLENKDSPLQCRKTHVQLIGYYFLRLFLASLIIGGLMIAAKNLAPLFTRQPQANLVAAAETTSTSIPNHLNLPLPETPVVSDLFQLAAPGIPRSAPFNLPNYSDPDGLFEILPADSAAADPGEINLERDDLIWQIIQEDEASLVLVESSGLLTFTVQVIHTGYEIAQQEWLNWIEAREKSQGNLALAMQEGQSLAAETKFEIKVVREDAVDPDQWLVITDYRHYDAFLAISELFLPKDQYQAAAQDVEQIFEQVKFYPEKVLTQPVYNSVVVINEPLERAGVQVPAAWISESTSGENTWVATFSSPDRHAVIQLLVYDDGEHISGTVAGNFALFLLNSYMSNDIMVTGNRMTPAGLPQLEWRSPRYEPSYLGTSTFHSLGTAFVMLTVMYDAGYGDVYLPVLARAQNSFFITTATEPGE